MTAELLRGRYEPLEVVGKGGEGEVLCALDHLHGRRVALKIRRLTDESSRAELLSEARLLLSLRPHPGLPLVREDFFVDDRYVIAMDWIAGTNLEVLLEREGRPGLDPGLAIGYLAQAADALAHLHDHAPPVVHGDIKPANLILTSEGRVALVDFGLSSTPADELRRVGTAGYVAPEIAAGGRPTASSDVYSFAATALALLTGEPPTGPSLGWGSIDPDRVAALERIVRSNLATDPRRRDPSAAAVAARLERWWGADLPSGAVTLLIASGPAEQAVDEVARAHRGHCVAPVDDGPVLVAFSSARDGLDAARVLAGRLGAAVGAGTGDAEPQAGRYRGEVAAAAARLAARSTPGEVLVDGGVSKAVGAHLPPELGLADAGDGAWSLVAPELEAPAHAATCPYRGLMPFQTEDAGLFFGRDEVVAAALERCLRGGFLAVVGVSGSGKSSLVRAGLVPAFRRAREGSVVVLTPGRDPEAELRRSLRAGPPSLVAVDQLEEAFAPAVADDVRRRFFDRLIDLPETGSTSVVVTLRADFYGRCVEHPRLAAAVAAHQCLLGPMRLEELRRAVEGPARVSGLRFEPGLIDAMLGDVDGQPGALPLLSHALYESWGRKDGRVLTGEAYRDAGGVRGAIAQTAEAVFRSCTEPEQALMRQMCLRLTELGDETEDTRRRVPLADLSPGEEATAVLEQMAAARLLVLGDDSAELAHEALIREWPRLRDWLAEDREALRARRLLANAARTWDEADRDEADLYRGPRLAAAAELGEEEQLARVERAFLDASREAQERALRNAQQRARRLRALLAVVASALVAALIAGAFALVQRRHARHTATVAQAGRLAAQSRETAAQHPDLAILLALEAERLDDSVDTRGALLGALEHASRIHAWLQAFRSPVVALAFSPDRNVLATVTSLDGTTLWDTTTWRPLGPALRSAQGGWEGADFSPDGRTLAIAGAKGRVELWDVASRRERRELIDPAAEPDQPMLSAVRFTPDGKVIAAGPQETNHATLWDVRTGHVLGRPIIAKPPGTGGVQSISFSPDSKLIALPGVPGRVGIWNAATGERVGRQLVVGQDDVEDAIFAGDGRTLIVSDDSGAVSTFDIRTRRRVGPMLSVGSKVAGALALSPDDRLLAAASYDGSVFVWDAKTGRPYGAPLTADTSPVNDVAFSPDGRTLVSAHLRSAVVWSMNGEQVLGRPLGSESDLITDASFSPDGKRIAAGHFRGDTVVFGTASRRPVLRIPGSSIVTAVSFRPRGKLVAVGTIDGHVRFFDAKTGAAVGRPLDEHGLPIWQIAFSPDGELIAAAVDRNGVEGFYGQQRQGEVQLWNVRSRTRVGRRMQPGAGSVLALAFSRDGKLLTTGSYAGRLDLWDVKTQAHHGRAMRVADDGIPSVVFDPDGRFVAAGGAIGPVRVWRVADQQPAYPPLSGHDASVIGTSFAPSGSLLATTSITGGTRLWDPATGLGYGDELIASPRPASVEPSVDVPFLGLRNAFNPQGTLLVASGVGVRTMVWDTEPADWRKRACAIVGRNLSREEWRLYLPPGTRYRATCAAWPLS